MTDDTSNLDPETTAVDRDDALAAHDADREPTAEEERLAEQNELSPETAEAYKAANERGANVQGEGQID